ncbi:MAG: ABC transporter, permease protein 1 (cluster 1, maltose/g3p/polyamine/iron) [Candidatus Rifleibacterium amylolyticum]|nr:MAG: ABC transporter, permease protein 1 (cluster 1, maltose/g3p/polyamine/iron) [Candidatus Rifleibacterium amylolyticum]
MKHVLVFMRNDYGWKLLLAAILITLLNCSAISATEEITLKIWDFPRWLEPGENTDRFTWMNRKIKEFEAQNPGVKVDLTKLTWQRGHEKLKIAAVSGNYPDVAPGVVPLLFIRENLIEPVDEYLNAEDRADYFPAALKAFEVKGKTYGWPWYMGGQLLYLNADIFASAGVELPVEGRWTPEEFTEKMAQIQAYMSPAENTPGTNGQPAQGHYPLGLYFQKDETANLPFLMCFGGSIIDRDGKYAGDSEEFLKGIKWVNQLREMKIIPPDSGGRSANDIWTAFGREKRLAAGAFGLWGIKAMTDKFPTNFEVVHFPAMPGRPSGAFLGTSGFYVFKNSDQRRVKLAMQLARFLTLGEQQRDLVHYTQFPTRRSAGNIYASDRHMTAAWQIFQEGQSVFADSRWPQIDEEVTSSIQQSLLGRVDPLTAMRESGERVNRVLSVESGSISEDVSKSSHFASVIAILSILAMVFALLSRQAHLIMIVPAVSLTGLFLFYPLADALLLAFRDYRIGEVGGYTIENFLRAWNDPRFIIACKNTMLYSLLVVPANVFTALVVASLIHGLQGKTKSFFRAAYYLPGVASVVVLTMVWRWLFNTEVGLFNSTLRWFGMSPVGWLSDPSVAFISVIISGILKSPGGAMLIYLASMANIPNSLYEAADLEGADAFKKWWHITVPLLGGTTTFLMITGVIAALQVFAQVLMLTDGGPGNSTQVVVLRVYTSAFRDFDFGLSSAMALILFAAIMVITLIQRRFSRQEVEYLA